MTFMQEFFEYVSSLKGDEYPPPLYRSDGSSGKVDYFKADHITINSDELFREFLKTFWHGI